MLEFYIYDDDSSIENIKLIIEKIMMNSDEEYKISSVNSFSKNWKEPLDNDNFKICLLSVNSRTASGLTIAKYLREKLSDWQSMIIFISNTNDYKYEIIDYHIMPIDYLLKTNSNYNLLLESAIKTSLKNYDNRPKTLKYNYKNTLYNIRLANILYIEKEKDSKICLIKTTTNTYMYSGNLKSLEEKLDKRFIKCNRSYIINVEQVVSYNIKSNLMIFNDGNAINIVSRTKKKEIINYLRSR